MQYVSRAQVCPFFDNCTTRQVTVIPEDDIFLDDAKWADVHTLSQRSCAINDGGGMNRQDSDPQINFEIPR